VIDFENNLGMISDSILSAVFHTLVIVILYKNWNFCPVAIGLSCRVSDYHLEILCFSASVIILTALLPFAFTNKEHPGSFTYRSLSEVNIRTGIFT
jgi:hypothetical protein